MLKRLPDRLLPGLLGSALFLLNNVAVIHGLIAQPRGFLALGVHRDPDVAQYLTWLRGLERGWTLPNYHAPWTTRPGLVVPGLVPASLLERWLKLDPAAALQLFSLAGYICTAYALVFFYKTFCQTRRQAFWAFLLAFGCVPVASLPGLFTLFRGHALLSSSAGAVEFINSSDGFLHGLGTWPLMTFGTCAQVLSMALLARYCNSREQRWLGWLGVVCFLSALLHPFEIFVTVTVAVLVLVREPGPATRHFARLGVVLAAAAAGLCPYLIQSLRVPWVHEVTTTNRHLVSIMPGPLLAMVGLPAIMVVIFMLFDLPRSVEQDTVILRTWFITTLLVFYVPGIPFAVHVLDGFFFVVGLLLTFQIAELLTRHPDFSKSSLRFAVLPIALWMLFPHVSFWRMAWKDGIATHDITFFSSIAPIDESMTIEWLRKNASPDDLVLATEDAAPWVATAPIHSFASHYVFSLQKLRPADNTLRNSFFDGTLSPPEARELLQTLGVRFIVVPNDSRAKSYLDEARLKVRFAMTTVYELPNGRMKPYGDPGIIAMGSRTSP